MIESQISALLYHKVDTQREVGVTRISPKAFRRHMIKLKDAGWETILPGEDISCHSPPPAAAGGDQGGVTLSDFKLTSAKTSSSLRKPPLYSPLLYRGDDHPNSFAGGEFKGGARSPKHFHLIFDDGYEGIYNHAYPILEEIGYKAMVFIPSGYIGKENDWDYHLFGAPFKHMNRQMLIDLHKAGWMIGSHGIFHKDFRSLDNKQLRHELVISKEVLSNIIEDEVEWISFPFGRYGKREIDVAIEVGYKGAIIPVLRKSARVINRLQIIVADAVYSWDPSGIIIGRLERRHGYKTGRLFRTITNRCSYGTLIWKRLFNHNNHPEPLAKDE